MSARPSQEPIDQAALEQAAEWFAALRHDEADEADRAAWQEWLAANPEHRRAWAQVEALDDQFRQLDPEPARAALNAVGRSRRQALKGLAALAVGGPALWAGYRLAPVREWRADLRTATGEIRATELADGTRLWLSTATAVNVRLDGESRVLELVAGEMLVQSPSSAPKPGRPLVVATSLGEVRPVGTRFSVREENDAVTVGVYQGRVRLRPARRPQEERLLNAGQRAAMDATSVSGLRSHSEAEPPWVDGVLRANGMRLDRFLDTLAEYRFGYLGYDAAVADLRLVGAFPLEDTDRALAALEDSLPVRVRRITPWFVRVEPR